LDGKVIPTHRRDSPGPASLAFPSPWGNNPRMVIGDRLREPREEKKLSQATSKSGRACSDATISRVENGHTVPAIETLEKLARAFEVPMYQLFYDGAKPPTAFIKSWPNNWMNGVCFFRSGNSFRLLLILIHSSERTGAPALMRSND
jgi:transcriptional regulator with XRE-family HTH domain